MFADSISEDERQQRADVDHDERVHRRREVVASDGERAVVEASEAQARIGAAQRHDRGRLRHGAVGEHAQRGDHHARQQDALERAAVDAGLLEVGSELAAASVEMRYVQREVPGERREEQAGGDARRRREAGCVTP